MDSAHWPQEIIVKPLEDTIISPNNPNNKRSNSSSTTSSLEKKVRPQKEQALNCPRCNSTNTKFCYYNNYSLTQPRYFCKACKRYWTEGGSLRNIPVGGGSRKNKKPSFSANLLSSKSQNPNFIPNLHRNGEDLNLGFPQNQNHEQFRSLAEFMQFPTIENASKTHQFSRICSLGDENLQNLQNHGVFSSGFPLSFTLDGISSHGYNANLQEDERNNNNGRIMFSFEDLKPISNNNTVAATAAATAAATSTGYWTGLLGSGGSW